MPVNQVYKYVVVSSACCCYFRNLKTAPQGTVMNLAAREREEACQHDTLEKARSTDR